MANLSQRSPSICWWSPATDELEVETAFDLQEVLDRLALKPLGIVAIGASLDVSPYYLAERPGFPTAIRAGRID